MTFPYFQDLRSDLYPTSTQLGLSLSAILNYLWFCLWPLPLSPPASAYYLFLLFDRLTILPSARCSPSALPQLPIMLS